ncbi:hypothetical protein EV426DRAFT_577189 [Tirmania nivea]|nr:hypothetical protein EV426DRAFT_577189 [Tirmania nivea]
MNERDNNTVNTRISLGPRYHHPILLPKPIPIKINDILNLPPPAPHIDTNHKAHHDISIIHHLPAERTLRLDTYHVPAAPVITCTEDSYIPTTGEHIVPQAVVESQSSGDYRGLGIVDMCGDDYHNIHCECGDTKRRVPEPRTTYSINGELPVSPIVYGGMSEYERSNRPWSHGVQLSNNDITHYHEYDTQHTKVVVGHYRCRPLFFGDKCGLCPCIKGRRPARN